MARQRAVGLDIGSSAVRAAEVSFSRGDMRLDHFGQVSLPDGAVRDGEVHDPMAVSAAVKKLWSGGKFEGKHVILGVANRHIVVRQASLLWMPEKELRASLPMLVSDLLPMPVETAILDFVPLEEIPDADGGRELNGLLLAASEQMVLDQISAVRSAGLEVDSVDLTPFAMLRSVVGPTHVVDPTSPPEAVIDIGSDVTNIVVHQGGAPRFVRILMTGGHDITRAIADRLGVAVGDAERVKKELASRPAPVTVSEVEARNAVDAAVPVLLDEIRRSLDYYVASSQGTPLGRVVLSGGGSFTPGLVQQMQASVRAPLVRSTSFGRLTPGKTGLSAAQLSFAEPLAAVPVGLALGGVA